MVGGTVPSIEQVIGELGRVDAKALEVEHALQAAADFIEQGYELLRSAVGDNPRSEDEQTLTHCG
jgi:hypothetical protein